MNISFPLVFLLFLKVAENQKNWWILFYRGYAYSVFFFVENEVPKFVKIASDLLLFKFGFINRVENPTGQRQNAIALSNKVNFKIKKLQCFQGVVFVVNSIPDLTNTFNQVY